MCEQNTLSKLYGNSLQTSSLWHRADRGTTRSARDPSGTTRLRTCPQDDIVFLAGGFAPCTPIRNCEHSCLTIIVQFDILFFHKQVCQQSGPPACGRVGWVYRYSNEDSFAWQRVTERNPSLHSGRVDSVQNGEAELHRFGARKREAEIFAFGKYRLCLGG